MIPRAIDDLMGCAGIVCVLLVGLLMTSGATAQSRGDGQSPERAQSAERAQSSQEASANAPIAASRPAAPGSYGRFDLTFARRRASDVEGTALSTSALGAVALGEHLELGARLPLGLVVTADPVATQTRGGLLPAQLSIGTGARWRSGGFGARLIGALGPAALDLDAIDPSGLRMALALELAVAHAFESVAFHARATVGYAQRGAPSLTASGLVRVLFAEPSEPLRPFASVAIEGASDLGASVRVGGGLWLRLGERGALRAGIFVRPDGDRSTERIGASVSLFLWGWPL